MKEIVNVMWFRLATHVLKCGLESHIEHYRNRNSNGKQRGVVFEMVAIPDRLTFDLDTHIILLASTPGPQIQGIVGPGSRTLQ